MTGRRAIAVLISADLLDLNRAVGIIRRRNLAVESIATGPAAEPGVSRLTLVLQADSATTGRLVRQLEKMVGVRRVFSFPVDEGILRELALVRVRASSGTRAELLDAAAGFGATVAEEAPGAVVFQLAGSGDRVPALLRALERFGIMDVARSGAVALERAAGAVTLTEEAVS